MSAELILRFLRGSFDALECLKRVHTEISLLLPPPRVTMAMCTGDAQKETGMNNLITCLAVSVLSSAVIADTWTVDDEGKADFNNIQDAIDASADGDTIVVSPGTYGSIWLPEHSITIIGSSGPEFTFIDAQELGTAVVRLNPCECIDEDQTDALLSGFTITGGLTSDFPHAAGVVVYYSRLIVENCIIEENHNFSIGGGGASCYFSDLSIRDSIIRYNSGGYGGGINVYYSSLLCENVQIYENAAAADFWAGGGIDIWSPGDEFEMKEYVVLRNVTIEDNFSSPDFPGCEGIYNGGELIVHNTVTDSITNSGWIAFDPEYGPSDLLINGEYWFIHGDAWYGAEGGRIRMYIHEQDGELVSDRIRTTGQFGVQHEFDITNSIGLLEIENLSDTSALGEQFEFLTFSTMPSTFSAVATSGFGSTHTIELAIGSSSEGGQSALLGTVVDAILITGEESDEQNLSGEVHSLISGDFNGDDFLDICLAMPASIPGWHGQLLFLINGGTDESNTWAGFSGETLLVGLPNVPKGITSGDVGGDGWLDVIATLPNAPGLAVAINMTGANGTMGFVVDLLDDNTLGNALNHPIDVSFLPIGGESQGNLVVINEGQPSVAVLNLVLPLATTTVVDSVETSDTPTDVKIRELNSAIVVSQTSDSNLLVFTGPSNSPLAALDEMDMHFGQADVAICDINGDGISDLIVSIPEIETVAICLGVSDGTYQPWLGVSMDGQPSRIATGDFDADGDLDMAVLVTRDNGQSAIDMYRNNQSNDDLLTLNSIGSVDLGNSIPKDYLLADLDGNGTDDFVVVTGTSGLPLSGEASGLSSILMNAGDTSSPDCQGDIVEDGTVDVLDLLLVINFWGNSGGDGDINYDGAVDVIDLLGVIDAWGPCP
jgi:hypothetical protein